MDDFAIREMMRAYYLLKLKHLGIERNLKIIKHNYAFLAGVENDC